MLLITRPVRELTVLWRWSALLRSVPDAADDVRADRLLRWAMGELPTCGVCARPCIGVFVKRLHRNLATQPPCWLTAGALVLTGYRAPAVLRGALRLTAFGLLFGAGQVRTELTGPGGYL